MNVSYVLTKQCANIESQKENCIQKSCDKSAKPPSPPACACHECVPLPFARVCSAWHSESFVQISKKQPEQKKYTDMMYTYINIDIFSCSTEQHQYAQHITAWFFPSASHASTESFVFVPRGNTLKHLKKCQSSGPRMARRMAQQLVHSISGVWPTAFYLQGSVMPFSISSNKCWILRDSAFVNLKLTRRAKITQNLSQQPPSLIGIFTNLTNLTKCILELNLSQSVT